MTNHCLRSPFPVKELHSHNLQHSVFGFKRQREREREKPSSAEDPGESRRCHWLSVNKLGRQTRQVAGWELNLTQANDSPGCSRTALELTGGTADINDSRWACQAGGETGEREWDRERGLESWGQSKSNLSSPVLTPFYRYARRRKGNKAVVNTQNRLVALVV